MDVRSRGIVENFFSRSDDSCQRWRPRLFEETRWRERVSWAPSLFPGRGPCRARLWKDRRKIARMGPQLCGPDQRKCYDDATVPERIRVLVVDDDPEVRSLLGRVLTKSSWSTTEASSGADAMATLGRQEFDVVLLDVKLPDASGLDILRWARESDVDTEFVILTGNADVETAVEAMRLGAYDFVAKPWRNARHAAGDGAVRTQARRVQRSRQLPRGPLRGGRRRHALPGRDRRDVAGHAGTPAAGPRFRRGATGRRGARVQRRRAHRGRHQQGPESGGHRGSIPLGPLLPRGHHRHSGARVAPPPR